MPNLAIIRGNLTRWSITNPSLPATQRFPKVDVLLATPLWKDEKQSWIRDVLVSTPIKVDITPTVQSIRVSTNGPSVIHVLRCENSMPPSLGELRYGLVVIDTRRMAVEDASLIKTIPGKSKFLDTPVLLLGRPVEVEAVKREILREFHGNWVGDERYVDVFSETGPTGVYIAGRKRVTLLLPDGSRGIKVPPMFNITGAATELVGWVAVIGLLRPLWAPLADIHEEPRDWMLVVSPETDLPVALNTKLDDHPSVVYFPLQLMEEASDVAQHVGEHLKTASVTAGLDWISLFENADHLLPLFQPVADAEAGEPTGGEVVGEEEGDTASERRTASSRTAVRRRTPYWNPLRADFCFVMLHLNL